MPTHHGGQGDGLAVCDWAGEKLLQRDLKEVGVCRGQAGAGCHGVRVAATGAAQQEVVASGSNTAAGAARTALGSVAGAGRHPLRGQDGEEAWVGAVQGGGGRERVRRQGARAPSTHLAVLHDAVCHGVGPEAGGGGGAGGGRPGLDDARVVLEAQGLQRRAALGVVQLQGGGRAAGGCGGQQAQPCVEGRAGRSPAQPPPPPPRTAPTYEVGRAEADQLLKRDAAGPVQPVALEDNLFGDVDSTAWGQRRMRKRVRGDLCGGAGEGTRSGGGGKAAAPNCQHLHPP